MKNLKLNKDSSWAEISKAFEIVNTQKNINEHIELCHIYNFSEKAINEQLGFMYGKDYRKIMKIKIIV